MSELQPGASAPSDAEVIGALSQTGFILEFQVARILRAADFYAYVNYAYTDPETGKSREIDVKGEIERRIRRGSASLDMFFTAIIECKNTSNPFIVLGESGYCENSRTSIQVLFDPLSLDFPGREFESIGSVVDLDNLPGAPELLDFVGHQLVRMNLQNGRWKVDNNSVYDSIIYPLAKAWKNQLDYNRSEAASGTSWQASVIYFTYPIIVTAGPIFTVDVTGVDPKVEKVRWTQLSRRFESGVLRGNLIADIVSFEFFEAYVKERIISAADQAYVVMTENINLYDPEWLLSHLGIPKQSAVLTEWLEAARKSR